MDTYNVVEAAPFTTVADLDTAAQAGALQARTLLEDRKLEAGQDLDLMGLALNLGVKVGFAELEDSPMVDGFVRLTPLASELTLAAELFPENKRLALARGLGFLFYGAYHLPRTEEWTAVVYELSPSSTTNLGAYSRAFAGELLEQDLF